MDNIIQNGDELDNFIQKDVQMDNFIQMDAKKDNKPLKLYWRFTSSTLAGLAMTLP